MVKKSSAVAACIIVCVFSVIIASSLTLAGGYLYISGSGLLQSNLAQPTATAEDPAAADYDRLDEIRQVYHDAALEDVDDQTLLDGAAQGMANASGDLYSDFFTKEEYAEFTREEAGSYVGIGVSVNTDPDDKLLTAVNVYKGSPAEKGGMLVGDKILAVDDTDITQMSVEEAVKLVRGEAGTQVRISVLRGEDVIELIMTRAEVVMNRTEWKMLENGMGYIRIIEFSGNAADLFDQAIKELKAQGMKGFILDLRNNPGGSLDVVKRIADELFPAGPIITMVDKNGNTVSRIDSGAGYLNLPMVVLINENSASASELLSGGIQDYKVGTLVGVTTYGKGVAQSFAMLSDGSVLKYTANKYLTGGGRCPQAVGIQPDVEVELDEAVLDNPMLLNTDQDNQYQRAVEELAKMLQ